MRPTSEPLERTFELARELLAMEASSPVTPSCSPEELLATLDLEIGAEGVSDDELFGQIRSILETTPRTTTRRFFNQLFSGRDEYATGAEILSSLLNISMYTYKVAGPHVLIERLLTTRLSQLAGFGDGEGIFAPGGSVSNFYAMVMARNEAEPRLRDLGSSGATLTMYTSELSHYSVLKNAGLMGVGRQNVRPICADADGTMRPDQLRRTILDDLRADRKPFLINATTGTTVQGAFDPMHAIADIAEEFGIWLHVDGALGASALFSEQHRMLLDGIERADSLTWDTHKMMGVPLTCSVVLTRKKGLLRKHFTQDASYLFQDAPDYAHGHMSMQCGRANDAFKLWAMWKKLGDAGLAERVDTEFANAQIAAQMVRDRDGMTLCKSPQSVNVCFEVTGKSSVAICDALRESGEFVVGYGVVDKRRVVRLACVNYQTTAGDLALFFDAVERVAAGLDDADNACGPAALASCGEPVSACAAVEDAST